MVNNDERSTRIVLSPIRIDRGGADVEWCVLLEGRVWGKVAKNDNLETRMRIEEEALRYHKEERDFGGIARL